MAIDPRKYVTVDKRFPENMVGDAGRPLMVNQAEDAYEHSTSLVTELLVGQIIMWPLDVSPPGFLPCDGSSYDVDDYPALGALLGGAAGGTFRTPDITFAKNSRGAHTLTQEPEEVGPHDHGLEPVDDHEHVLAIGSVGDHAHDVNPEHRTIEDAQDGHDIQIVNKDVTVGRTGFSGAHTHTGDATAAGGHDHQIYENMGVKNQPACTLINFCIRT